jgi:ADP-ribose pyrophosphatase YjhB (NUDIX family)
MSEFLLNRRILHVAAFWLWIGFAGGAAVLLLVATPLESALTGRGASRGEVDIALTVLALAWIAASFFAALGLEFGARFRSAKARMHVLGALACGAVFVAFLQGGSGVFSGFRSSAETWSDRFTFGPYPDRDDFRRLHGEGYSAVVSLLNPIIPFEAVLLEREREAARETGLELVEIPMLPWVSDNRQGRELLSALARSKRGRYYVHCYLGRHRADLARFTILEAEGFPREAPAPIEWPPAFERGPVTRAAESWVVGPLPTEEEWVEFVMRSGARHVVSLLDPSDSAEHALIEEERDIARNLGLEFHLGEAGVEAEVDSTIAFMRGLEGMVYVHAYGADPRTERLMRRIAR